MSGGKIKLISTGFEDLYLTVDPQITFFKMVYKRYTNFSQEPVVQFFNSEPDFGKRVTCNIAKSADLISNIYCYIKLPSLPKINSDKKNSNFVINKFKWVKKVGFAIIKYVELEINGQLIDKLYGDWLNIWSILSITQDRESENILIGNVPSLYDYSNGKDSYNLYVPINFYFNRNKGLSLPVVALNISDIKVHIEFSELDDVLVYSPSHYIDIEDNIVHFEEGDILTQTINNEKIYAIYNNFDYNNNRLYYTKYNKSFQNVDNLNNDYKIMNDKNYYVNPISQEYFHNVSYPNITIIEANLIVNFIFLDNLERKKFILSNHEYLITQLQYSGEKTINNINCNIKLNFTNNCKEIYWIGQLNKIKNGFIKEKFNYTSRINYSGKSCIENTTFFNNGLERFQKDDKYLYNYLQYYLFHNSIINEGVNMFSFSLNPESYHPSGSCNFSKIDDIILQMSLISDVSYDNPILIRVYSLNYNILRIVNGIGGLVFT